MKNNSIVVFAVLALMSICTLATVATTEFKFESMDLFGAPINFQSAINKPLGVGAFHLQLGANTAACVLVRGMGRQCYTSGPMAEALANSR